MRQSMKTLHMKLEDKYFKRISSAFKESPIGRKTDRVKILLDEALKARGQ